jgi:hypothetical protein
MTWIDDVLAGKFDDDDGGRQPENREVARDRIRSMRRLADSPAVADASQGLLTREDYQVILELSRKLEWVATVGIRIRQQQSNSAEKGGKVEC